MNTARNEAFAHWARAQRPKPITAMGRSELINYICLLEEKLFVLAGVVSTNGVACDDQAGPQEAS